MARLSSTEKRQLAAAAKRRPPLSARPAAPVSPRAYVEFATFAARFNRTVKPVRFVGDDWKL